MRSADRSRLALALVLVLSVTAGLVMGGAADAKKKGKGKGTKTAKTFTVTRTIPQAVPLFNQPTGQPGFIKVPIGTVGGKKLKGKVIGLDGVSVTTTFTGPSGFAASVFASVIAPNGRSVPLSNPNSNNLVQPSTEIISGPTTETPNSSTQTCTPVSVPNFVQPPCSNPDATLGPPYAGTLGNIGLLQFVGISPNGQWMVKVGNVSTTTMPVLSSITVTGRVISAFR